MPASASPGYKGAPPGPLPLLQKPPPSLRCMHTTSYLFHPTRPPDMYAIYHPTRPPDSSPTRGHGTSLHGHHPPGLRFSCAVPTLLNRSSSMPRTFLPTTLFGGRRSTSPRQNNDLRRRVLMSSRSPQQKHETRSSAAESSTSRHHLVPACTMPSRIRKSAQQHSCSSFPPFFISSRHPSRLVSSPWTLPQSLARVVPPTIATFRLHLLHDHRGTAHEDRSDPGS
ncbi:hypothetical protein L226DRAFT_482536 [Lentinus tigrinus ALCF2SS1-7]|uniref:Uncharacterized protein n=1 Tax=Lentinus tigrinus ALCF2SS1-6 TaxID=1328759 RepID=A0A5C2SGX5_9APHY|nr:hypothetical protein L227DRAFT_35978 [Lentinus tigrinus ALCF2SS1-6]RPD77795.1 hypothetical protein L226DRAFT_482536 [Lentinus tigrinus ALCF2SS1-7]